MRHAHKLVAASLLAAMLLMPLLAAAVCADAPATTKCCQPGCPMGHKMSRMSSRHNGPQITESTDRNCCAIKNSTPAPLTESQVVAPVVIALAPAAEVAAPLTGSADQAIAFDTSPPPIQTQARLCTFRI